MKKLVIDVENTTSKLSDKYSDYTPYNPNNKLVSIGWMVMEDNKLSEIDYVFIGHNYLQTNKGGMHVNGSSTHCHINKLKRNLKEVDVVIAHNAKYDIQWLKEAGFDLDHLKIEDTMIREYVMARGRGDISFRLADTCKRYGVAEKGELFEKYPDLQISEMPINEVEEYGRADIQACAELYLAQEERLNQPSYIGLRKTIEMMNEFCGVLVELERNGVKIDEEALNKVEKEFTEEAELLKFDINKVVKRVMGDTVVNLDSPQQLSEVIYSRHIKEGCEEKWVNIFNIGKDERGKFLRRPKMSFVDYANNIKTMTDLVLKTEVSQCLTCLGTGKIQKLKKDGLPFKNQSWCKVCDSKGAIYTQINEVAGFKMRPNNIAFSTVNGFSTSQTFLEELLEQAEDDGKHEAKEFLRKLMRLSSVSSYLSNFVMGIKTFKQSNNILHTNFNQCITATGRLSSTKPNLQNMPREATFPIRKVFVSRFEGGTVTEVDFAQLEFRAAVHLARCNKGKEDINGGIDIHNQTAKIISAAGQPIERQEAKSRTFKPLYGGVTGSDAERKYYRTFLKDIYTGIDAWHSYLEEKAIETKMVTIETGRQYLFPNVERAWHGGATGKTQIVNFPVQGFATADIVPIAIIRLYKEMQQLQLKSIIVLTVHDSIMVDTYPGEETGIQHLLAKIGVFAEDELKQRYNIDMFVPLTVEVKYGTNAMEMKKAA